MHSKFKISRLSILVIYLFIPCHFASAQFSFEEVQIANFEATLNNAVAFEDIDGDGDEDLVISGSDGWFTQITKIYLNDNGNFSAAGNTQIIGTVAGTMDFSDLDGDGDKDLVISGYSGDAATGMTRLYHNDQGSFSLVEDSGLEELINGVVSLADMDGDGDEDMLIAGYIQSIQSFTDIYSNDGGVFTLQENSAIEPASNGDVAFFDFDGDDDLDLAISGYNTATGNELTRLYINEDGNFSVAEETEMFGVRASAMDFSDVDNDGDQDLFVMGRNGTELVSYLYLNEGGNLILDESNLFHALEFGEALFGDLDGDGDEDLMITGLNLIDFGETLLYSNDQGAFTLVDGLPFEQLSYSTVDFSDVDGDGDLDVFLTGTGFIFEEAKLYLNGSSTGTTGIAQTDANTFSLKPNPTNGIVSLDLSEVQNGNIQITVFEISGKAVFQTLLTKPKGRTQLDLTELQKGAHILQITSANGQVYTTKLIKE